LYSGHQRDNFSNLEKDNSYCKSSLCCMSGGLIVWSQSCEQLAG